MNKFFTGLNATELELFQEQFQKDVRQRAWANGSPVYYGIKGLIIAEYENGKKMVVEEVNSELVETREYEEQE